MVTDLYLPVGDWSQQPGVQWEIVVGKIVHFRGPNHSGSFSKKIRSFRSFRSFITSGACDRPLWHRPGQPCYSSQSVHSFTHVQSSVQTQQRKPRDVPWNLLADRRSRLWGCCWTPSLGGMGDVTLRSIFHKCDYKVQQKLFSAFQTASGCRRRPRLDQRG